MLKKVILLCTVVLLAVAVSGCSQDPPPTAEVAAAATSAQAAATDVPPAATAIPPSPTAQPPTATDVPPSPTAPPEPTSPPPTETVAPPTPTEPPPTATEAAPTATEVPPTEEAAAPLAMNSAAFLEGGEIPVKYSCFGDNQSPPLTWEGVPEGTESFTLIVDDPDSQPPGFVHWVIYNIPSNTSYLAEDVPGDPTLWDGSMQGSNDFAPYGPGTFPGGAPIKLVGYDGPCPGGEHRYVFALSALDAKLDLPEGATRQNVVKAMKGHVLAETELLGLLAPP